ncbi:immunoglobulin domain protein [Dictyocaulus viviparus]|uniref:Immunoglobulin domain protein n=1 Tax=Dictyocaulus viviparus TaxID=29172 RepID=A0A0D8YG42_DICVI|nr:immunoglobulin domain protein [Dictyocaulus viviparus]
MLTKLILLLLEIFFYRGFCHVRLVSNFMVVAKPIGIVGTENVPLQSTVDELWCGIEKDGDVIPLEYGEFTRLHDGKIFKATIIDRRAKLYFNKVNATVAAQPFLQLSDGSIPNEVLMLSSPKIVGVIRTVRRGDSVKLHCPVFGYPEPHVIWRKDGNVFESSENISYDGNNLLLLHVSITSTGIYTCIADNSFPIFPNGPSMSHQLIYEQKLNVF